MPRVEASVELVAAQADAWRFVAEPHHLADWWPGVAAAEPDRRGLVPGARWKLRYGSRPGLLRRPAAAGMLLVREVREPELLAWHLTADRLDVELVLVPARPDRTRATLAVSAPWLVRLRRSLPRRALQRLHDLCQTAATLDD
ncbi:MAG: SRPBCC domain-containing protein [Gaiellaceae bacterium]